MLHKMTLHFRAVGLKLQISEASVLPSHGCKFDRMSFFDLSPAHQKIIASDGWRIYAFDTSSGSHRIVHQTESLHRISCIHPITGNIIFSICRFDDERYNFFSLEILNDIAKVAVMHLPHKDGHPFYGLSPIRIIELKDGGRIYICGSDGVSADDGTRCYESGFSHVDSSGKLLGWARDLDGEAHLLDAWSPCNGEAMFEIDGYGIYAWSFETHEVTLLAGSEKTWGCRDGAGWKSRFWNLKRPTVNQRYLFVRTEGPRAWQWRPVMLDLQNMHVQSVRFVGVDHDDFRNWCVTDNYVYVLAVSRGASSDCMELFCAPLESAEQPADLSTALTLVDLSEKVDAVLFRLSDGVTLQIDRRLLMARSAYFRDMLTSGLREDTSSEVDLRNDSAADNDSLSVLLRFVHSDAWDGANGDAELAFRVRALADRYRLHRLVELAEAQLLAMLNRSSVLSFLGRIVGIGGALEEACWELVDSDRETILKDNECDIEHIVVQNPEFAKQLILFQTGAPGDPVARLSKRQRCK